MKLSDPDFISMEEAAKKFNVSIEHLRWLAEELVLPVYVRNSGRRYSYAKVINPSWNGDFLRFCTALVLNKDGNETSVWVYPSGYSYSMVMIKPSELKEMDRLHSGDNNQGDQLEKEHLEKFVHELKSTNLSDKEIAKRLKQEFPDIYASRIGRLLPANPGMNIEADSHRKRGKRLLEE